MMTCENAKELIPLYVEADLDAAEMQQVSLHLETCNLCCDLAAEFQASQSVLHRAAWPEFDEALFTELRAAVQYEIARPTMTAWLTSIWHWKPALAVSAALLLLLSSFAFLRRFQTIPAVSKSPVQITTADTCCSTGSDLHLNNPKRVSIQSTGRARFSYHSPTALPAIPVIALAIPSARSLAAVTPPPSIALAEAPPETMTADPEMLRLEIQTADPNIKIIWLTPKEPITRTNAAANTK